MKKLVYIAGQPYWMTPEGRFVEAEMRNGMPVEHFIMRQKATVTAAEAVSY